MISFEPWPKIARLNREIVITEKIDGTNAAVGFVALDQPNWDDPNVLAFVGGESFLKIAAYAQSRKKVITPAQDNYGFARWVQENADALYETLGYGLHFGEWWGSGVNRGYGLKNGEKRFSLFNTPRYGDREKFCLSDVPGLGTVPILYEGMFNQDEIENCLIDLTIKGSVASPGFMDPEGVIVFHTAAQTPFKVTIKGDEKPKGSNE